MALRIIDTHRADGKVRALQLTDTHLFADTSINLLGINTLNSLHSVIEAIKAQDRDFDAIFVTGDISQDYSPESYRYFASMILQLGKPVFFVPGNHDDGPLMYRMLGSLGIETARNLIMGRWQFVFLNSEAYGVAHGWVQRRELEYLRFCLERTGGTYNAVLVHHLPQLLGSDWLDAQTMHNFDEFNTYVNRMNNVKLVLCGHVHQEVDVTVNNIRYIASPSTSIQFEPKSHDFALDLKGPGWRYLDFNSDGSIDTEVYRLPQGMYMPYAGARGY